MDKIIRITGLFTVAFSLFTVVLWLIGALWETPNEGVVHNLCRASIVATSITGSVWMFLFLRRESKEY